MEGYITHIQHFSIHDGSGIRTTVFLKGCNLKCYWCHNPETLNPKPEIQLFPEKCIGCGECITSCPQSAHVIQKGNKVFLRERCIGCGKCTEGCFAGSLILVGKKVTSDFVVEDLLQDKEFYETSGGGITISGGEPLFQHEFTFEILKKCKEKGIHTAIESNIAWNWERIELLIPVTDLFIFDIKMRNSKLHKKATGLSNELVLSNAKKLDEAGVPIIVRTPVISGLNDNMEEIGGIAEFISTLKSVLYYELLPYHPLGISKYKSIGKNYDFTQTSRPSKESLSNLLKSIEHYGISVKSSEGSS
jgi:pyruvate formate lyase activating enzyme